MMEAKVRSAERVIQQLEQQVNILQSKNLALERSLASSEARLSVERQQELELDAKNQILCQELRSVDQMTQELQLEKDRALSTADRELNEAKYEMLRNRSELGNLDIRVEKLNEENKRLQENLQAAKRGGNSLELDNKELKDLVGQQQQDKKRLMQRVEKLTNKERELVLEIERLRRKSGSGAAQGTKTADRISKVDSYFKGIEADRDYWKNEAELLAKMLRSNSILSSAGSGSRSASPIRASSRSGSRARSPVKMQRSTSPVKTSAKKVDAAVPNGNGNVTHLQGMLRILEDERDHYKRELELLKASSPYRARSPPTQDRVSPNDSEMIRLRRERDELQTLLDKFERHMGEIQANVKVLTQERDSIAKLYEEAKDELQRMRQEVVSSSKNSKVSVQAMAVLRRVEAERDDVINDYRRMTTERDSLRERLKVATETALNDKARLEQRLEDLHSASRKTAADRDDLATRAGTLRQRVLDLEEQQKGLLRQLEQSKDDLEAERLALQQQRLMTENAQRQGQQLDVDVREAREHCTLLEDRCHLLEREIKADREEAAQLRSCIKQMDCEKERLQVTVDERSNRSAALETELRQRESSLNQTRSELASVEHQLSRSQEAIATRDRDLKIQRKQLDSTQSELIQSRAMVEQLQRELNRKLDDLSALTKESQALQEDLQETTNERDDFHQRMQNYMSELRRVEEQLKGKELERVDLLEQYRQLSLETDQYQSQCHQLESDNSSLRLELASRDVDVKRVREQNDKVESECTQLRHTSKSQELQLTSLTRSCTDLEDQLRLHESERDEVLHDLSALRDLCAKLESGKEQLQRQLTSKGLDLKQVESQVDELVHENDVLREQFQSEQNNKRDLETILSTSREKEFQSQLDSQERGAEINMLRDRLELQESKVEQGQRELARLRARSSELETEVERLGRQLTNERFEKERYAQELRRLGSSSYINGIYPSSLKLAASRTSVLPSSRLGHHSPTPRSYSPYFEADSEI